MNMSHKLSVADREFLDLVTHAAFANPFSAARTTLDKQIGGTERPTSRAVQVDRAIARVRDRLHRLEKHGSAKISEYTGSDARTLGMAHLFEVFHQYLDAFDQLLLDQLKVGDTPLSVPFANDALATLLRRGFSENDAIRYFAMFYQLRRAYYFIDRSLPGESPCQRQLRARLWNNVFTSDISFYERHLWNRMEDFSTLLLGETGSGKGAAASAIGRSGFIPFDAQKACFVESFTRSFIALNLSQFPPTLIESELFGHRKGSFTGAVEAHTGALAHCSPHGAIFLDEIGDISVPIQIKLLQVLQERTFTPVGSHERQRFSGRVIAATNRSLDELRHEGKFRDDFYYRLCSDVIQVPTLRQRLNELPAELDILLEQVVTRLLGHTDKVLICHLAQALRQSPGADYAWPGNVRELEQAARRILLVGHYEGQTSHEACDDHERFLAAVDGGTLNADDLLAGYCAQLHEALGSYEEVARRTQLDRRTVRRYVLLHGAR